MNDVPSDPVRFLTEFLPGQFEAMKDTFVGKSSVGSMAFRVVDGGDWSMRLSDGAISVSEGVADDVIIQISIPVDDFYEVMIAGLEEQGEAGLSPETRLMAFKALFLDETQAGAVRNIKGSIAFSITDGGVTRRLIITPGDRQPNLDNPECRLECQMSDYLQLQAGKALPMQLAMSGKLRIVGDATLSIALNAVLM